MRILVVDDQQSLRQALSYQLQTHGYEVIEAADAVDAVHKFKTFRPELILLDVILPEEDGYWVARQIRGIEGGKWTPIIFLSGQDHDLDLWQGIEAGGDDYLVKPVSEVVLRAKLHAMERLLSMRNELIQTTEELRVANERLAHISTHDELTGLANRRGFNDELHKQIAQARASGQNLTLILCDIDHFKRLNDAKGHVEGDACLRQVGALFRACCHRPTDYAARYGGEEFGLILPNTPKSGAMTFVRAMQHMLRARGIAHPDSPVGELVTLSGGITTCIPDQDTTVRSMLMRADEALYLAKARGRNRFFSFEMQQDSIDQAPQLVAAGATAS